MSSFFLSLHLLIYRAYIRLLFSHDFSHDGSACVCLTLSSKEVKRLAQNTLVMGCRKENASTAILHCEDWQQKSKYNIFVLTLLSLDHLLSLIDSQISNLFYLHMLHVKPVKMHTCIHFCHLGWRGLDVLGTLLIHCLYLLHGLTLTYISFFVIIFIGFKTSWKPQHTSWCVYKSSSLWVT